MAAPPQPLRGGRLSSASLAGAPRTPAATGPRGRAAAARRRDRRSDLGRAAAGGVRAAAAAARVGYPAATLTRARAPQCARRRAADPTHAAAALAPAACTDASRRGGASRRAALPRHVLYRQTQGRRQGVAGYGVRRRELVRRRPDPARALGGRRRDLLAYGCPAGGPPGRVVGGASAHGWRR